ncbi:MAG: hypothetical protein AAFO82_21735, partial [Bacteroidota bacterium]
MNKITMEGNLIINSLLCYLSTAKNDYTDESLYDIIHSFYSHEEIKSAKTELSNLLKKDITWRRDPDKKGKDLRDIIELYGELAATKNKVKFVCDNFKRMPPIGMELVAPILVNLVDEMSKISDLLPKILDVKTEVLNSADCIRQMRVDVNGLKSNFDQAINGLKEASTDIADKEVSRIEDIHSFRQSIGAAAAAASLNPGSFSEALQRSFSDFSLNANMGNNNNENNRSSSHSGEKVTRKSTGAIS